MVYFLPPYSPDLNPIEEAFAKVKAVMKANESMLDTGHDLETLILTEFSTQMTVEAGYLMQAISYVGTALHIYVYLRLISIEYYNLIGHSEVSKSLRHLLIYLDTCNWSLKLKLLWLD